MFGNIRNNKQMKIINLFSVQVLMVIITIHILDI